MAAQEAVLPHSPRNLAFLTSEIVCFGYAPDHALFSLKTLSTTEVTTPIASVTSSTSIGGMGMGALSGLGGYMTLGLGSKTVKPCVIRTKDDEVLIAKDSQYHTAVCHCCPLKLTGFQTMASSSMLTANRLGQSPLTGPPLLKKQVRSRPSSFRDLLIILSSVRQALHLLHSTPGIRACVTDRPPHGFGHGIQPLLCSDPRSRNSLFNIATYRTNAISSIYKSSR